MPKVIILGAGIAGLSSGWLLKNKGVEFIIFEKQSYPGGLARSFNWHGFYCDFAAHRLFTSDEHVLHQLLNLVPMGRQIRRSRIYLRGHWMRDPLDVIELAQKLSITDRLKVLWTYLSRPKNLTESNFETYVLRRYGERLYQVFFKPYTEKLFGIPGDEISVLWARQKVRLANPLDNLRENTKTKFQYFYYPLRGGYGAIAERLFEEIKEHVLLNTTVTGFEFDENRISSIHYEKDGVQHQIQTEAVISTLPLSLTTRMLGHSFRLHFQKVDAVYLLVDRALVSDYHWTYFIDDDVAINRMVEFKNMSPIATPQDKTVLCAEVTQNHADPAQKVIDDLTRIGLIQLDEILDKKVVRENFAYPVYSQAYEEILQEAQEIVQSYNNLYVVGRAAEFRHREVDDNFASAIQTVDQISRSMIGEVIPGMEKESMLRKAKEPKIYAVILTYNHYADTQECLQSLVETDFPDLEIVLVDNGSSDLTPDKVRQDFPGVYVIENEQNLGVPAGYNVGFQYGLQNGADYILMLNNDTIVAPDMITKLLENAEADQQAGIVMPKVLYYGTDDQVWSSGGRYRRFPPAILFNDRRKKAVQEAVRLIEYAPSCGLLIHRRAFERAGLFDPGYFFFFDDWDFSERVRAHGLQIVFVRDAVMWHKESKTTKGSGSELYWYTLGAGIIRFYRRHGRPVWFSLPVHVSYFILRDFIWKRNWKYWPDFRRGMKDGLQRPLGNYPLFKTLS
jgi:GT2 family glycosyltransferase/protoporphyrinogen oxidase